MIFSLVASVFSLPSNPVYIDFHPDYTFDIQGVISSQSNVVLQYDLQRAVCPHASTHGADTWTVAAHWMCNNDFNNVSQAAIANTPFPGATQQYFEPTISNPPTGDLAIWFVCSSEAGTSYDSNYGQNWHFSVQ
ncbi:hypothetical protein HDV01_007148 [Terramyces sp. JEL0728]|nr:hypothetical protein HDV01_007148 [Terramyces sp. JEL0728]